VNRRQQARREWPDRAEAVVKAKPDWLHAVHVHQHGPLGQPSLYKSLLRSHQGLHADQCAPAICLRGRSQQRPAGDEPQGADQYAKESPGSFPTPPTALAGRLETLKHQANIDIVNVPHIQVEPAGDDRFMNQVCVVDQGIVAMMKARQRPSR
jgi:hypothetical protein